MATSMAAALAATLPSPSAAPAAPLPMHEAIPASMSKVIDIEAEIPLTTIQLDALVVAKIIKHGRETPATAHGLLLGLDLDGTLEVSNSFPLPHYSSDDDDKSTKSIIRYQTSVLRSLKEVQVDDGVVGFYQATTLGAFYNQTLVDTQAIHQEKLRHGGVIIVHDLSRASCGNAAFRAFRLSASFLDAHKKANFSTASLLSHQLTFASILQELPLKIRTNSLLSPFLEGLVQPCTRPVAVDPLDSRNSYALPRSFSSLDMGTSGLTWNLEKIVDTVEHHRLEEGNLAYLSRQIVREKARVDSYVTKRKEENALRVGQGLAPLPEEDVSRLFRVPPEPSRLESMLLLGQSNAYTMSLEGTAITGLMKMNAIKTS